MSSLTLADFLKLHFTLNRKGLLAFLLAHLIGAFTGKMALSCKFRTPFELSDRSGLKNCEGLNIASGY